ncbi:MAG TPA: SRPBCC family protein [Kofleriaceae bacterium]|nr:SRPBCC family protein [Kofleriaceae bacterium]
MRELAPYAIDELGSAPFQFVARAELDADPLAVFAELGTPSLWFPMMRRSVWRSGATSGVGALREVDVLGFGRFRERMLAWDPGERLAFTMIATSSPLVARMAEDWVLSPGERGTHVEWRVVMRPSAIGRLAQPALPALLRGMFAAARRGLGKRAGSYPRAKHVA